MDDFKFDDEEEIRVNDEDDQSPPHDEEDVVELKATFADRERTGLVEEENPQLRQLAAYFNKDSYPMFRGAPQMAIMTFARQDPRHKVWHMPTLIVAFLILTGNEEPDVAIPKLIKKGTYNSEEWVLNGSDIYRYYRYISKANVKIEAE